MKEAAKTQKLKFKIFKYAKCTKIPLKFVEVLNRS